MRAVERLGPSGGAKTKVLVLLCKRHDLSWDAFQRYWREQHGPLAVQLPGLRQYVHNEALEEGNPPYGVAEFYFDSPAAFHAALASPEGQAALADLSNFVDLDQTGMTVVAEAVTWRAPDTAYPSPPAGGTCGTG